MDPLGTGHFNSQRLSSYKPPSRKKKGFWQDQISTGGGLGGAIAGGAAGTAIAPGIGTIIGALAGGFLGGGGGQIAENAIVGEKDLSKDVLSEATLNGIFGAGPLRVGSLAVRGGGALAKGLGKEGLMQAGKQALVDRPIRNAIGKSFIGAGDNMAVRSVGATPSQLTNFQKKFGEDIVTTMNRHKIVGKGLHDVTKLRQSLDQQFGNMVKGATDVPKSQVEAAFKKAYTPLLKSTSLDKQATGKAVKTQAEAILKSIKGKTIPASQLNGIKSEFDSLVNYTARAADPAKYGVNKSIADVLRDSVHSANGAKGLKETGMEISKLRQLEDILQAQGNRGRGSNPLGLTDALGGVVGGSVASVPGGIVGIAAAKAANSGIAKKATTKLLENSGRKLAAKSTNPMGVVPITARIGLANIATSDQSPEGNMFSTNTMMPTSTNTPMSSNMQQSYQNEAEMSNEPSIGGIPKSALEQAMVAAMMDGNSDAFSELKALYDMIPEDATQSLNATQQQQANNANSALADLQTVAQEIQNDPSVIFKDAIPGGSLARGLTGTTNYDAAKENIVDVIARLRSGAAITEDEAKRYMSLLPSPGDSQDAAMQKLMRLNNLLQGFANPTPISSGMDSTSISQALGQ